MNRESEEAEYSGLNELLSIEKAMPNYNEFIVRKFVRVLQKEECSTIVDFGAGIGTLSGIIHKIYGCKPLCVEIDKKNNQYLMERGFKVFENCKDVFEPIDAIFSSNVLEHIEDDQSVLQALYDKLNTGGVLFLYLPAFEILFSGLDLKVGHYRRYDKEGLLKKIHACGFKAIQFEYADSVGFFASIVMKAIGYNERSGLGSEKSLRFYDKYILNISRFLDWLGLKHVFGKNIVLVAQKRN